MAPLGARTQADGSTPSTSPASTSNGSSPMGARFSESVTNFRKRISSISEEDDDAPSLAGSRRSRWRDRRRIQLKAAEDDAESEMFLNLWQQRRLLPPYDSRVHGRPLRRWCWFLMLLALYEVLYIPLQLAFEEPRGAPPSSSRMPHTPRALALLLCSFRAFGGYYILYLPSRIL